MGNLKYTQNSRVDCHIPNHTVSSITNIQLLLFYLVLPIFEGGELEYFKIISNIKYLIHDMYYL